MAACNVSCAVTMVMFVLLAVLCPFVHSAYVYNRDENGNYHHHPRTAGYHSGGTSTQHRALHHKHHQHGSNSGRIQQAAVGIISRGRLVPSTATTITTTPSSKLSPLDRLMNRLDSEERRLSQVNHQTQMMRFDQGNGRGASSPSAMLRSYDHRYAQARSRAEESYEDDEDEEGEDNEDIDDGNIMDEDEDEDKDEDEENEEEEERLSRAHRNYQYQNHKPGRTGTAWVSDIFIFFTVKVVLLFVFLCRM